MLEDEDDHQSDGWELMLNSVVKVFCTSTSPNYAQPWQMKRQSSSTSSGFVVSGKRIIGNAHGVTNASSIRVRKHGDAKKYPANIEFISHESDLAILTVPDPQFWNGLLPLELGGVPRLHENVSVAGYPTGGDNLSVTKGVVSRVVVGTYSHSGENLLCVQIDAAINSGNSGGPAMQGNKVVGVAFETLSSAQNIGYIIPVPVIRHFLEDIDRHKRYTSFPRIGFTWQKMENESLRKAFRVPDDKHGVLISSVEPLDNAFGILRRDDVLLSVDDHDIADDGTVFFRRGERVSFRYVESTKFVGEEMSMKVLREGKEIEVKVQLEARKALCPLHLHDHLPSYYVHAGLVFTVLSRSYLYHEWGKEWHKKAPVELVEHAYYGILEKEDQQVVILSQILVDDINTGYQSTFHNLRVERVNGVKINNLSQIVQIVEASERSGEPFIRFDLDRDKIVCLETEAARTATSRILKQNNISSAKSIDLMTPDERAKLLLLRSVGSANNSPHTSPKMKLRTTSISTHTTPNTTIDEELEIVIPQSNL
jgi:S1-C subfamily serine protease